MTNNGDEFDVPPPGHFIREELESRGWSRQDLAFILGASDPEVKALLSGRRGISADMIKALGKALGVSPMFLSSLQKRYELSRAREPDPAVARKARLQMVFPIREMIKRGWLADGPAPLLEAEVISFFGASSVDEIAGIPQAARRASYIDVTPAEIAWLYRVKQLAEGMSVGEYSCRSLRELLPKLRDLMIDPHDTSRIPGLLAKCGVRFVVVEGLTNSKIDGACLWLGDSPVIGMSLKHDRIDNYWLVLRHEIEHVLQQHGRGSGILDVEIGGTGDENMPQEERIANEAAREFCVPAAQLDSFIARKNPCFSERDLVGFSRRLQVHPGIVAGQLRRRINRWDIFTRLLVKVRHAAIADALVDGWGHVAHVAR